MNSNKKVRKKADEMPLQFMLRVMNDPNADPELRSRMAQEVALYIPKRQCVECGKVYINKRHKYCSKECCLSANKKQTCNYSGICLKCGKEFKGQKNQKYCSYECMRRMNEHINQNGERIKRCIRCKKWKIATNDNFHKDKSRYDELCPACRICDSKASSAYKKTPRGKELARLSRERNIETIREYKKRMRPIRNEREKLRAKTDPSFQLDRRMRCIMWVGLKKEKGGRSWQELAGYSLDTLRNHIEKKFKDGMNWERFLAGEIHIDHKIPRSAFNFNKPEDIDFKKCWALENLQPLWAKDNIRKGAKLEKPFQPSLVF